MASIPNDALVMVGDGSRAIFLRNSGTGRDIKLFVEDVFGQDNPATREQGTDAPTRGESFGGGPAANAGNPRSNIEPTDWHQLNEDRFANEIADKLYELAHASRYQQLVIVAPPKVLGVLRQALHKEVLERVVAEIPKELTHAPIPAIQEALVSDRA